MSIDIQSLITIGISSFVATNIDDIFLLMLFFSSLTFTTRQVILGQYMGIGSLVALSAMGSLLSLVVPVYVIGLLGIIPILIGLKKILTLKRKNEVDKRKIIEDRKSNSLGFAVVASVTIANGGDNIGVYVPIFAKYNQSIEIILLSTIYMIMTAVWCSSAYYLVSHPLIAVKLRETGHIILPFVLIGLGIYILLDSFVF